jgi:uncharacterized protein
MTFWFQLAASGFAIGALIGLTGVGAGSLTTPLLITGFGIHPAIAIGTDLFFACITKLAAGWRHNKLGHVDWRVFWPMVAGSLTGAVLTLLALRLLALPPEATAMLLRRVLSVTLLISAAAMTARITIDLLRPAVAHQPDGASPVTPTVLPRLIATGFLLGVMVTLTSIGAGAIGVVALTALFPSMAAKRIVGIDIVHAIPLTLVAGLGHMTLGHVDAKVLFALLAGSIPGILIGSRLTLRLPDWALRGTLVAALLYAAKLLWQR